MSIRSTVTFFALMLGFALSVNSSAMAIPDNLEPGSPCGVFSPCPRGMYCSGAVGEADSGICLHTGPYIVMCKVNRYVLDKLGKKFLVFAMVMLGVAFFLAKVSWGMVLGVVLGSGVMYGSTKLIKRVTGRATGFCSSSDIVGCYSDNGGFEDLGGLKRSKYIKNLDPLAGQQGMFSACATLECHKLQCKSEVLDEDGNCTIGSELVSGYGTDMTKSCGRESCTTVMLDIPVDYFKCKNNCTGIEFAVKSETGLYNDCIDFMNKQKSNAT